MSAKAASIQGCIDGLIGLLVNPEGDRRVFSELCRRDPKLAKDKPEIFYAEYKPSKLALGCVYWVGCCANHRIEHKEFKNLYFKNVMQLFQSPDSLAQATRFSEGLYASNADTEQSPALGVLVHLFHKLGLRPMSDTSPKGGEVSAGFHFMMEVAEALKVAFEAQFDDFFYAHKDLCTAGAGKKE
jgi:hypothetical protein